MGGGEALCSPMLVLSLLVSLWSWDVNHTTVSQGAFLPWVRLGGWRG